ncbi:hypothetical protein BN2127_JRS10_05000 [Bacillus subtilis]|nr:hypothetical protein BN2127_JRS10_05000 [Bacillus subtilis]
MKSIFDGRTFHLKSKYTVMNIGAKYCNNVATAAFPSLIEAKYVYCTASIPNKPNNIIL